MFSDLIRGKRVAVIGGSSELVGIQQGSHIDSHDVVLRVNLHWPCPIFYEPQHDATEDIGERTDIVFQAMAAWRHERFLAMPAPKLVLLRGAASILRKGTSAAPDWSFPHLELITEGCRSRGVELQYASPTYDHLYPCWSPNTGLLALKCVMEENPAEVYVAGFDFSFFHYRAVNFTNHEPLLDRKYFRDQIASDPRVRLHSIVRKAMEMEYEHPFDPTIKML